MNRVLLINNYDSFVYNVLHLLKRVTGYETDVVMNDCIPFGELGRYSHIVLSPGPGIPSEAGQLLKLIEFSYKTHSILGICLGHQAIAQYFGASLLNLSHPLHGHKSTLTILDKADPLVGNLHDRYPDSATEVALYHSWAVDSQNFPSGLTIGSVNEDGIIMSLFHKRLPIFGLQFHPESVITTHGQEIIKNWRDYTLL